jgi:hypothetical protein
MRGRGQRFRARGLPDGSRGSQAEAADAADAAETEDGHDQPIPTHGSWHIFLRS